MSFQAQSALIAGIISLVLALFVLFEGFEKPAHRAFAQLSLGIFLWNIFFFLYKVTGHLLWDRLLFIGVFLIPGSALQFVLAHLPQRAAWQERGLMLAYLGGALFLASAATPLFDSPWWNVAAIAFVFPPLFLSIGLLYHHARRVQSLEERRRLQFLSSGGLVAALLGPTDLLPGMGIPFPQLGTIATLVYMVAVATGILRYHLFDLPEMVGRGIFLLLQAFFLGGSLAFLAALSDYRPDASMLSAFAVTLVFLLFMEPLRRRFEQGTTEWFIKDYAALQRRLREYSDSIAQAADPQGLERVVTEFLEGLPGVKEARLLTEVPPSLRSLLETQAGPVFLEEEWRATGEDGRGRWRAHSALFPLRLHTELVGAIEIRRRKDRDAYSNRELEAFTVLANQVAAVLMNLRVRHEIQRKEKLMAIGELAAGLAHEIRNPLGAIKGAAQYLQRDRSATEPRPGSLLPRLLFRLSHRRWDPVRMESQELLRIILEEVDRLNLVVSQFLDYARPFQKELAWVDLAALVGKVIDRLTAPGLPPEIRIALQVPEEPPMAEVDPEQIKQVLYNLIRNALEAMPDGGEVIVSADVVHEEQVEVAVSDRGVGISSENLSRLFQPFFTTKESGTGLGLAICYRIVEGHGGAITVESEPSRGSRFRVRLPLRQAARRD